jgi:hypothetical protein
MGKISWAIPTVALFGICACAGAYVFVTKYKKPKVDDVPLVAADTDFSTTIGGGSEEKSRGQATPLSSEPSTKRQTSDSKPQTRARHWPIPAPENLDKLEKLAYDLKEIVVNDNGTRALARSNREVYYVDLTSGKILQTYRPARPRWDYQKPDTHFMFLSPNARFIAIGAESHSSVKNKDSEMAILEADSGRTIAKCALEGDTDLHHFTNAGTFTSGSDLVLLPGYIQKEIYIQAISTDGARRTVNIANSRNVDAQCRLILPVPKEPTLIIYRDRGKGGSGATGISALDLRSGKETAITAVTIKAWALHYSRSVQLSPDGKLLLVQSPEQVQLCDWKTNRRLQEIQGNMEQFHHPRFTPDGKRFVIMRLPQYEILRFGFGPGQAPSSGIEKVPVTIELYDVENKQRLGEFAPVNYDIDSYVTSYALSRDGKTIALTTNRDVHVLDFRSAFGVEPLPPVRVSQDNALPLR